MMKIIPTFIRKLASGLISLANKLEKYSFIEMQAEYDRQYGYAKFCAYRKIDKHNNFTYFSIYISDRPSIELTMFNIFMVIGVYRKYKLPELTQEERDSIKEDL